MNEFVLPHGILESAEIKQKMKKRKHWIIKACFLTALIAGLLIASPHSVCETVEGNQAALTRLDEDGYKLKDALEK